MPSYGILQFSAVLVLLTNVKTVISLECYSCIDISDVDNCHNTSQCHSGQSCYTNSRTNGQTKTFTLGCTDNQLCGAITGGAPGIVGRDINERQTDSCHECCGTDNCNNLLCHHLKPTTCIDDVKFDCPSLNAMFNICQDVHHSKKVCPKFCQLCSLVDGNWADWSQWSSCDITCNNGTQTRNRTCSNPAPAHNGLDCGGKSTEVKICNKQACPVHGGWTEWLEWGSCSHTCGVGIQRRHRKCTNPYPSINGNHCFGDTLDDRLCIPGPCANGGWSDWGSWTTCSATCGGGLRSHSRTCTNPVPSSLGKFCDGDPMQIEQCNKKSCVPNVVFNAYYVTDQSPAAGQTMIFSNVVVNEGGAYSNSTGEFTAPVDGIYSLSAQLCFAPQQHMYFDIKVGGTTYASAHGYDHYTNPCKFIQTSARVRKGEKVIVQWTTTSYTSSNYITQTSYLRNFFTGTLVHPQI